MDRKAYNRWYYLNYRKKGRLIGDGKQFGTKTLGPGRDKRPTGPSLYDRGYQEGDSVSIKNYKKNGIINIRAKDGSKWVRKPVHGRDMFGNDRTFYETKRVGQSKLSKRVNRILKEISSYKAPIILGNKEAIKKGKRKLSKIIGKIERGWKNISSYKSPIMINNNRLGKFNNTRKIKLSYKPQIMINNNRLGRVKRKRK